MYAYMQVCIQRVVYALMFKNEKVNLLHKTYSYIYFNFRQKIIMLKFERNGYIIENVQLNNFYTKIFVDKAKEK